ncbi:MAG: trypsin-like peptidase domain-containing protein [Firmicutes bacterium]|nr:trypsin-like peptidase domain-containing protein [Bacillota bacterium]
MAEYYEGGYHQNDYYTKPKKHFPWAIVLLLMLFSAVGGGFFSYYLTEGRIAEQTAIMQAQIDELNAKAENAQNNIITDTEGATIINTTQMMLTPEAMEQLLATEGSENVIDLIYGEVSSIYNNVSTSVVGISNIIRYTSFYNGFGMFNKDTNQTQEIEQSTGSGVIYTSDGYIVTNYHVIEGADRLQVTLADGSVEEASVIGFDQRTDLALIKIERKNLPAAKFGSSATAQVGDFAMAIGNPGGETFSRSLTTGTISGLNRVVTTSEGLQLSMIQTDAAINPGNSGGALVNSRGEVIGINTVKISSTDYEGMGFAIPTDTMEEIVSDLMLYQKVIRPALGISMLRDIDSIFAEYNRLKVDYGVLISPIEGGAAASAGLQTYDIITAIDGEKITSSSQLQNIIFEHQIGDTVQVSIYRYTTEQILDINVTLGELE